MSLRKIAGLLAGFALAVGLIGAGVSASFTDSVTAKENINVGTFSCGITDATAGATFGAVDALGYAHSVSYTAPTIGSSDAGSAPFSFTVMNTGSIPDVLTVATSPVSAPWSIINAPFDPVLLVGGASNVYNTGVAWTELDNSQLGASGSVTWTVSCIERSALKFTTFGPATVTEDPAGKYTIVSVVGPCAPYAATCPLWGGIVLTFKNSGKLIGDVAFSFTSSGDVGGGAPRFSLPISTDGTSTVAFYAFLDAAGCGAPASPPAANPIVIVSTTLATCAVNASGSYANWAAFAAAHPAYQIAPGALPFIIADGGVGTYIVSAISE